MKRMKRSNLPEVVIAVLLIFMFFLGACTRAMVADTPNAELVKVEKVKDKKLLIYNCDQTTAIGYVFWDTPEKKSYTNGEADVYGRTLIILEVSEGDILAVTQYHWSSNTILDFREVTITEDETEMRFSCTEGVK